MKSTKITFFLCSLLLLLNSCQNTHPNQEMIDLLQSIDQYEDNPDNDFSPEAILRSSDSLLNASPAKNDVMKIKYRKAIALLQLGQEQKSIDVFQEMLAETPASQTGQRNFLMKDLAMAYLRLGERTNCFHNHSAESCIFPISMGGVHHDKTGSQKAIEVYEQLLADDPDDLESKWLLNIAYMTIGGYPQEVPAALLLKLTPEDALNPVKPFIDVAANLGLNINNQAGGSIVDDFNNDGYNDIITSSWSLKEPMHYFRNNGDGTFTDISDSSWLGGITGGLNIMQTDYNNDGLKDIFVMRGGWRGRFGKEPNSLLRNNGDGTFTDVTKASGLFSLHPTQAATWADFNNDGWLDVFIGNESLFGAEERNISELYINNKNGTFTEQAAIADCNIRDFVKGVTSGDYNNDGKADLFISTMSGQKYLFKNETAKDGPVKFKEVTRQAGLGNNETRTFPGWFFDYDNDGWLDILVCGYEFKQSLAYYAAVEATGSNAVEGNSGKVIVYRNKQDGSFEDVSEKLGLKNIAFAMGSNFGDIDNDGYLDFYLGTGNP
ncbi:MAG: VCBS repeat-containing protein, partial [Flavisolibacter sp.]|nr:VCBS repeat-containing protein [Flavisolibacter sp.]